jgi:hypothetical protein
MILFFVGFMRGRRFWVEWVFSVCMLDRLECGVCVFCSLNVCLCCVSYSS